jgi:predicted transcriptional regulator of viral defense system
MNSYIYVAEVCRLSYMSNAALRLRQLGPVFRSKDAVGAGISWRDLYRLRDAGEILELSRGLFRLSDSAGAGHPDFVAVCSRAPRGMVCLNSALAHWDLSDEIPATVHYAVPKGTTRPTIDYPPTTIHVFDARTFTLGRLKVDDDGATCWITDRERTVSDAFRLRHLLGEDIANSALRRYLSQRPNRARLGEVARELRAFSAISSALRILDA